MSDMHILEGTLKGKKDNVEMGSFTIAFHIPLDTPNDNLTFQDFVSTVPNISVAECNALKAGTLLEITESINYLSTFTNNYYVHRLKTRWGILYTEENAKYNFRVKHYLTTLAH